MPAFAISSAMLWLLQLVRLSAAGNGMAALAPTQGSEARARRASCSLACKDVAGTETGLSSGSKSLSCSELQGHCQDGFSKHGGKVRSRCPETCGQCKSSDFLIYI